MSKPPSTGLGGWRLLRRQLRIDQGPALLLGVVTFVVTMALALTPAVFAQIAVAELRQTLGGLSPVDRYLTSSAVGLPPPWADVDSGLSQARARFPVAVQTAVGDGRLVAVAAPVPIVELVTTDGLQSVRFSADQQLAAHVELIKGSWPGAAGAADQGQPVLLSADAAARLHWSVGERRTVGLAGGPLAIVLTGTFRAKNPDDSYWSLNRSVLSPEIFDDGNGPRLTTASAYVDPAVWSRLQPQLTGVQVRIWYPVDAAALAALPPNDSLAELTGVLATPTRIASSVVRLNTKIPVVLQGVQQRTSAAAAVLALSITAPCGGALAVLALSAFVIGHRRRENLAYLSARGAGGGQLRTLLGVKGATSCLPATVLGILAAAAIVSGELPASGVLAALTAGCVPVLLLIGMGTDRSGPVARASTVSVRARRRRLLIEVVVILMAAVALYTLVRRRASTSGDGSVDPLIVATPFLLSLAVCGGVGRCYPLPLTALQRSCWVVSTNPPRVAFGSLIAISAR